MSFNPSSPSGYLFYAGNRTRDFLALSLVNSQLELRIDLGVTVASLLSDSLSLNVWHTVFINRQGGQVTMIVDDVVFGPLMIPGTHSMLDVQDSVSIGGLEDYTIISPFARNDIAGFSGCIRQLEV